MGKDNDNLIHLTRKTTVEVGKMKNLSFGSMKIQVKNGKEKSNDCPFKTKSWQSRLWKKYYANYTGKSSRMFSKKDPYPRCEIESMVILEKASFDTNEYEDRPVYEEIHVIHSAKELEHSLREIIRNYMTNYSEFLSNFHCGDSYEYTCFVKALIRLVDGKFVTIYGPLDKLLKKLHINVLLSDDSVVLKYY